jgi:uncharacterized surface protein with fasciclin (FAS1) repeats
MTMRERKGLVAGIMVAAMLGLAGPATATTVMVGGAPMSSTKPIAENAVKAKNLTTLVAAVKAAGLVETLAGPGPFTVFAPTNAAFDRLPAGTVDKLVEPSMKPQLTGILTYHVVPGRLTAKDLMMEIQEGGGRAMLKTVQGHELTVTMKGKKIYVTDDSGNRAQVQTADVLQSNGVVHVVNRVLMPSM